MNKKTIAQILTEYPFVSDYFTLNKLDATGYESMTLPLFLEHFFPIELEDLAIDKEHLLAGLPVLIQQMNDFLEPDTSSLVHSLTILPRHDKTGVPEGLESLTVSNSQVISIMGPTGSGRGRLLMDIEWVAQGDTPIGRSILVSREKPGNRWRFSSGNRLVVQSSQNVNFVMDLAVQEFLELRVQNRLCDNTDTVIARVVEEASHLAGEQSRAGILVTSLSGGQPRTLMVVGTVILNTSPIVLIDEIENTGIDHKKALKLLMTENRIVLMAAHSPLLALIADRRIMIRGGGIHRVLSTNEQERQPLEELKRMDTVIQDTRHKLRNGQTLSVEDLK